MTAVSVKAREQELDWALTSSLVIEAAVDLLIAISLCYYLLKSRRHSVHQRSATWHLAISNILTIPPTELSDQSIDSLE